MQRLEDIKEQVVKDTQKKVGWCYTYVADKTAQ